MSVHHQVQTEAEVAEMHGLLHEACGLPRIALGMSDQPRWFLFLQHMAVLNDTPDGPFTIADFAAVLAEMKRLNLKRDPQFRFAMKPTPILKDFERFRDMALELRRDKHLRPRARSRVESRSAGATTFAVDVEPAAEADAQPLSNALGDFLAANNVRPQP